MAVIGDVHCGVELEDKKVSKNNHNASLSDVVSKEKTRALGALSPDFYRDMPDRIWETHAVVVGVCNDLNTMRFLPEKYENSRAFLERAKQVIVALLDETGRYEEYNRWRKTYEKE